MTRKAGLGRENIFQDAKRLATQIAASAGAAGPHNVLSATHADTTTTAPTRGDLIVADDTPQWDALAVGGANTYLKSDGTDPAWATVAMGEITGGDAQFVTLALSAGLANERVLTAGEGITLTDAGAGSTVTASLTWGTPTVGTIECDDAANAGTSTNPARSDHQHAIVCAAPGADSVNVAASAEGSAASFARSDHAHNLDEAIIPTWTGKHTFTSTGGIELDIASGDPIIIFDCAGANRFTLGVDDSDSDKFKINSGSTLANPSDFELDSAGNVEIGGDLNLLTGKGIIHADGVTDGQVLVADGTRYIPGTLADISGGAAQFVTLALDGTLANERVLTAGEGITLTDAGAGSTITVSLTWGAPVIGTIECDDAAAAGTSTNPARSDHQHAIVCAAAGNITPDDSAAEGSAASFARSDHTHGITCAAPTTNLSVSSTDTEGAASTFARSNHTHAIDSSSNPGAAASLLATDASGFVTVVQAMATSKMYVNETANAGMTIGVTINQGAADNELIAGKSSDVGHGATDFCETDTYFQVLKCDGDAGGTKIRGLRDADGAAQQALALQGLLAEDVNTTKTSSGRAIVEILGGQTSGASIANTVAGGNIVSFQTQRGGAVEAVVLIDEDSFIYTTDGGGLFVNETACADLTVGVVINQGANDDAAMVFKSSDVGHAMTGSVEADTYGFIKKAEAAAGGVALWGYKDATGVAGEAVKLGGVLGEAADTTKTTAGVGIITLDTYITDGGTGTTTPDAGDNLVTIRDGTTARFIFAEDAFMYTPGGGGVMVNETTCGDLTMGLCVNQAANDDAAVVLKSSDVAHDMTDYAEADTWGFIRKSEGASGGVEIYGFKDADGPTNAYAVTLEGHLGEAANGTKSTAGNAIIHMFSWITDGAGGRQEAAANANIFGISSGDNARFLFDVEGEMHSDDVIGVGDDWDEWDDLALAADLSRLPKAQWQEMMKYRAEDFERAGLVTLSTDEDGTQHAFVKHKAMLQFYACCFRDVGQRLARYERALLGLGVDPALLEA